MDFIEKHILLLGIEKEWKKAKESSPKKSAGHNK